MLQQHQLDGYQPSGQRDLGAPARSRVREPPAQRDQGAFIPQPGQHGPWRVPDLVERGVRLECSRRDPSLLS